MDEAEWLACEDPQRMLVFLLSRPVDERKLRLFACASLRRHWPRLPEPGWLAVEVGERYADHLATREEIEEARARVRRGPTRAQFAWVAIVDRIRAAILPVLSHEIWLSPEEWEPGRNLLREIFGNPFRPVSLARSWLTPNVLALAQTIYEERAFDRLPILSDALLDAGCDNPDILDHCRSPGPHVRGCWVVDLLLGKR